MIAGDAQVAQRFFELDPVLGSISILVGWPNDAGTIWMIYASNVAIEESGKLLVIGDGLGLGRIDLQGEPVFTYNGWLVDPIAFGSFSEVEIVPAPVPEPTTALHVTVALTTLSVARRRDGERPCV